MADDHRPADVSRTLPCRACGTPLRHVFVDLGMSPISNAMRLPAEAHLAEAFYPLRTFVCETCKLVQIDDVQPAETHFHGSYTYFSSYSKSWLEHARRYAEMMTERFGLGPTSKVVEVASNDGYLLQYFKAQGIPVLGIDPAANCAEVAERERGIPTLVRFFGIETAHEVAASGKADVIAGNNVLAHVPDINDFVGGLKTLLKDGGVVTIEFPHLLALIQNSYFDTIYHEHYSYLSLLAVERLFARHGLTVFDAEELPTHGGSLRIFAGHSGTTPSASERLDAFRTREAEAGLDGLEVYGEFAAKVRHAKRALLNLLIGLKEQGARVVAYGAAAKGNTLLNYCGIRGDFIDYAVDASPHKQGLLLPGTAIPVYAPDRIFETKPDYVLILPWNLKDEIMVQSDAIRAWGGKFIVPLPEAKIIP
ncbi:class I SAM-dependent methyltransferase [Hyphomicrobium sp.]|uniref:class I SAM-dependent methyltransferase n=1 Tax=Hyphomicrobium sp. TaxID=82 RepID=UPI002E376044|nr:class I SAM-dependent methyltransferase [Hyphomicrobium sp.]HEX2840977.1 class I SAM-dependent methyltransferase [Hyphomicrobium sp.]